MQSFRYSQINETQLSLPLGNPTSYLARENPSKSMAISTNTATKKVKLPSLDKEPQDLSANTLANSGLTTLEERVSQLEADIKWIKNWCLDKTKAEAEAQKWSDLAPLNEAIRKEPLLIGLRFPRIQEWPILNPVKKRQSQFGDAALLYVILLQRPCSTWDFFYVGESGQVVDRFFTHDAINALDFYGMTSYEVRYQLLKSSEYKGTDANAKARRKQLEKALSSRLTPTWEFWPPTYMVRFKNREISIDKVWDRIVLRS
jgi:hypothetical protein